MDKREFYEKLNDKKFENIKNSFRNIEEVQNLSYEIIDVQMPDMEKKYERMKREANKEKHSSQMFSHLITTGLFVSLFGLLIFYGELREGYSNVIELLEYFDSD